jgi:hypothetical protein
LVKKTPQSNLLQGTISRTIVQAIVLLDWFSLAQLKGLRCNSRYITLKLQIIAQIVPIIFWPTLMPRIKALVFRACEIKVTVLNFEKSPLFSSEKMQENSLFFTNKIIFFVNSNVLSDKLVKVDIYDTKQCELYNFHDE